MTKKARRVKVKPVAFGLIPDPLFDPLVISVQGLYTVGVLHVQGFTLRIVLENYGQFGLDENIYTLVIWETIVGNNQHRRWCFMYTKAGRFKRADDWLAHVPQEVQNYAIREAFNYCYENVPLYKQDIDTRGQGAVLDALFTDA